MVVCNRAPNALTGIDAKMIVRSSSESAGARTEAKIPCGRGEMGSRSCFQLAAGRRPDRQELQTPIQESTVKVPFVCSGDFHQECSWTDQTYPHRARQNLSVFFRTSERNLIVGPPTSSKSHGIRFKILLRRIAMRLM